MYCNFNIVLFELIYFVDLFSNSIAKLKAKRVKNFLKKLENLLKLQALY